MMSWEACDPLAEDDWVDWLDWSPDGPGISSDSGSEPIPLLARDKSTLLSFTSLSCRVNIAKMIFLL